VTEYEREALIAILAEVVFKFCGGFGLDVTNLGTEAVPDPK